MTDTSHVLPDTHHAPRTGYSSEMIVAYVLLLAALAFWGAYSLELFGSYFAIA